MPKEEIEIEVARGEMEIKKTKEGGLFKIRNKGDKKWVYLKQGEIK